jgi:hypothetical protein
MGCAESLVLSGLRSAPFEGALAKKPPALPGGYFT